MEVIPVFLQYVHNDLYLPGRDLFLGLVYCPLLHYIWARRISVWTCLLFVPSSFNHIQRIHKSFYMWPPLWLSVQIIKYWSSTLPVWTPAIITYFQTAQGVKSSTDETRCAPLHVKQSLNALTLKVASIPSPWQPRQGAWCRLAEPAKGWSGVKLPQCPVPHGAWREFNKSNMVRENPSPHTHTHTHRNTCLFLCCHTNVIHFKQNFFSAQKTS